MLIDPILCQHDKIHRNTAHCRPMRASQLIALAWHESLLHESSASCIQKAVERLSRVLESARSSICLMKATGTRAKQTPALTPAPRARELRQSRSRRAWESTRFAYIFLSFTRKPICLEKGFCLERGCKSGSTHTAVRMHTVQY